MQVLCAFQDLDNHLTYAWSNSCVHSVFISKYSLLKSLALKALDFFKFTAWMTRGTVYFKPDCEVLDHTVGDTGIWSNSFY
jgi:hypothetical protein